MTLIDAAQFVPLLAGVLLGLIVVFLARFVVYERMFPQPLTVLDLHGCLHAGNPVGHDPVHPEHRHEARPEDSRRPDHHDRLAA